MMKLYLQTLLLPMLLIIQLSCWGLVQPSSSQAQEEWPERNLPKVQRIFEIDFPGGSIDEYVEFLRTCPNFDDNNREAPVNILVTDSARQFQLPEIKVSTNMEGALGLLQSCSGEDSEVVVDLDDSGTITTIRVMNDERPTVTVINAKDLLLNMDEKDLLEVIDVGLDMQGNTSRVDLKLHQKTGLLFAKGTERGTQLVHLIVNELTGNVRTQYGMGGMDEMGMDMGMGGDDYGAPGGMMGGSGMMAPGGGGRTSNGRGAGAPGGMGGGFGGGAGPAGGGAPAGRSGKQKPNPLDKRK